MRTLSDTAALDRLDACLTGLEWSADTLEAIDPRAVRNLRTPVGQPIDADTLETLDPRVVRGMRAPTAVDADTLETLDPRSVRQSRTVNGLSDR